MYGNFDVANWLRSSKKKESGFHFLFMLFILLAGIAGWIRYGILIEDYPIIFTNSFFPFGQFIYYLLFDKNISPGKEEVYQA